MVNFVRGRECFVGLSLLLGPFWDKKDDPMVNLVRGRECFVGLSLLLGPFWDKKDDPMGAMQNLIDDQADEISELRHGGMADDRG